MELVELIAGYLIKVETLTKQDIDEIVATGHLGWYEKQEALKKEQAEALKQEESKSEEVKEETKDTNVEYPKEIKLPEDNQENSDETR